jgi:hypothetical protein
VYWSVHAVPAGIEVGIGSRALVEWVRSLALRPERHAALGVWPDRRNASTFPD